MVAPVLLFISFLSRLCPSQLQVQHGFLQKATKQTSSNGNVSLDASPMPLEELLGTTLTQTAKRATLQHGREADKRGSSTLLLPKGS